MLKSAYAKMKDSYLKEIGYNVPELYRSQFVHWGGGCDVQYIYKEFTKGLPTGSKALIIGVMGGRDYWLFKNLGFDVTPVDLGQQPDIPDITIANIEQPLPFEDKSFDVVLLGEILEHLVNDVTALQNVNRVLKDDGLLIASLPFYNDWEEGHMRVHSPESGKRLLSLGGFDVVDYLERPALVPPHRFNIVQHGLSFIKYMLTGRSAYKSLTGFYGRFAWTMGHKRKLRFLRKFDDKFGGYYLCRKGQSFDHVGLNKDLYASKTES